MALLLVAALVASYFVFQSRPVAASGTATLTVFTGSVQLKSAGNSASHVASSGAQLHQGDVVTTGPDTKAAINFPDGSVTRLDSSTEVALDTFNIQGGKQEVSISQQIGKTWNRVAQLTGGSTFTAHGPNSSTAEVRGTEFELIIEIDSSGRKIVRINTFSGLVLVSAFGQSQEVATGQSTTVAPNSPPTAPAPISEADKRDSWTVFNTTVDNVAGTPAAVAVNTLSQGETTAPQPASTIPNGEDVDLDFALGWPGSTFELIVIAPDGTEYTRITSSSPPIHIVVPSARPGAWSYRVHDVQSGPQEVYWVIVGIAPSKKSQGPSFTMPTPCTHTVQAGATDTWNVTTQSRSGHAVLSVGGLPPYGTFRDNGDGTATVTIAPPAGADSVAQVMVFTATASGSPPVQAGCVENVVARPRHSTVGGHVAFVGGPARTATLYLAPTGASTSTDGSGNYAFGGLGAGTYTVFVVAPTGYVPVGPAGLDVTVDGTSAGTANFTLAGGLAITTTGLPAASTGQSYSAALAATGGATPYRWTLDSGTLPAGLSLDPASGVIGGTPTTAGQSSFVVRLADNAGQSTTAALSITVNSSAPPPSGPTVDTASTANGESGVAYSQGMAAHGGTPPYTWSTASPTAARPASRSPRTAISTGLPAGLSIDSATGLISGTPTVSTAGPIAFAVVVTDANGLTGTRNLTLNILPAVSILATGLPAFIAGAPYAGTLQGSGGQAPYAFTLGGTPTPPSWLALSSTGAISGTPPLTLAGLPQTFSVTVTDALGGTATQAVTLAVQSALSGGDCPGRAPSAAPAFTVPGTNSVTPAVTSVSPTGGPSCGMTPVTIAGTNLSGVSAVLFGTAALTAPHSGNYSAQLQWSNYALDAGGESYMYQQVTLPSGPVHLNFAVKDFCIDGPYYDYLEVRIRTAAGQTLSEVIPPQSFCTRSGNTGYQQWVAQAFDISAFAGQTVQLWFGMHGDAYGYADTSYAFIDDVSIAEAPGLVVNGGFETGDMTGWSIGANPSSNGYGTLPTRGFVPRVTWGFTFAAGSGTTPDTIGAITPPQPAGTVDVELAAPPYTPHTYPVTADRYTYGATGALDHYALRIEPSAIPPAGLVTTGYSPAALNSPGILGPLNAGVVYHGALTLYGVDASGNDVGATTLAAADSVVFGGLAAPPVMPAGTTDPCYGGAHVGGSLMSSPVSVTALPLLLDVVGCKTESASLTAAATSGRAIVNGSSIAVVTRGGLPASGAASTGLTTSTPAGSTVHVTFKGVDAYGNGASGMVAYQGVNTPAANATSSGCSATSPTPPSAVLMENGAAAMDVPTGPAGSGLNFAMYGLEPGANEYGSGVYSGVNPTASLSITALAAQRYFVAPNGGTVTAGNNAVSGVYAVDTYCNVDPNYAGSATVASSDPRFTYTGRARFTAGTFSDGLEHVYTAGQQTITFTDARHPAITGTATYAVQGAAPTGAFTFTGPSTSTPGYLYVYVTNALDTWGNAANGTVSLTPNGSGSAPVSGCNPWYTNSVPTTLYVSNGSGNAAASFGMPGQYTITASDGSTPNQTVSFTVTTGPVAKFAFPDGIAVQATAVTGAQVGTVTQAGTVFQVVAVDNSCNLVSSYSNADAVSLTSTDPWWSRSATTAGSGTTALTYSIPAGAFASGVYSENPSSTYLWGNGYQTFTATDPGISLTGTSNALYVSGAPHAPGQIRTAPASGSNPPAATSPQPAPSPSPSPSPSPVTTPATSPSPNPGPSTNPSPASSSSPAPTAASGARQS